MQITVNLLPSFFTVPWKQGMFPGGDLADSYLTEIYDRIKLHELKTGPDHVTQVSEKKNWKVVEREREREYLEQVTTLNAHLCTTVSNWASSAVTFVTHVKAKEAKAVTMKLKNLKLNWPFWTRLTCLLHVYFIFLVLSFYFFFYFFNSLDTWIFPLYFDILSFPLITLSTWIVHVLDVWVHVFAWFCSFVCFTYPNSNCHLPQH